LEKNKNKT